MTALPTWRHRLLAGLPILLALVFVLLPAIQQPAEYHRFVDARALFGIPNFSDVMSNLSFLLVGLFAIREVLHRTPAVAARSWGTMFCGILLVSAGSAYYHLAPSNGTLVWDRLPMTIAFTAMTVAVLTEFVTVRIERFGLLPIVAFGASSVLVWHWTGDLRFYFWVQVTSVCTVLLAIFAFRREQAYRGYIFAAGVLYGLAIVAEQLDHEIFSALDPVMSGHTLKHLLAAAGLMMFPLRLRKMASRHPMQGGNQGN
jgi:predicted membrane chloride channel (bestrophin family)